MCFFYHIGDHSNQCPAGFEFDSSGPYCTGNDVTSLIRNQAAASSSLLFRAPECAEHSKKWKLPPMDRCGPRAQKQFPGSLPSALWCKVGLLSGCARWACRVMEHSVRRGTSAGSLGSSPLKNSCCLGSKCEKKVMSFLAVSSWWLSHVCFREQYLIWLCGLNSLPLKSLKINGINKENFLMEILKSGKLKIQLLNYFSTCNIFGKKVCVQNL